MGSNPIARSKTADWRMKVVEKNLRSSTTISIFLATWPSGKAEVCKTFIMGSNPIVASSEKRASPIGLARFFFYIITTAIL